LKTIPSILYAAFVCSLAACSSGPSVQQQRSLPAYTDSDKVSQFVFFHVPSAENSRRYVSASVIRTGGAVAKSGNMAIVNLSVRNQHSFTRNATELRSLDYAAMSAFADNPGASASRSIVAALGRHVTLQTVCKGMTVKRSTGKKYSGAAAYAVLAANGGKLTGTKAPPGLKAQPVPLAEFSKFGWQVNLICG
jgi:hypothetical protein